LCCQTSGQLNCNLLCHLVSKKKISCVTKLLGSWICYFTEMLINRYTWLGRNPANPEKTCRVEVHLRNLLNALHGSVGAAERWHHHLIRRLASLRQFFIRHRCGVHLYAASPYLPKLMEVEAAALLI
jgi:hypothetical protein